MSEVGPLSSGLAGYLSPWGLGLKSTVYAVRGTGMWSVVKA